MSDEAERIIYVVDDDAGVRKSTSLLFRSLGHLHWPYASGQDFLEQADTLKPGCVLLDVRMPFVGGLDVLAKLAQQPKRFAVIVMTGHGDIETAVKAMKLGAIDFLEKPFEEAVLLDAVDLAFKQVRRDNPDSQKRLTSANLCQVLTPKQIDVLAGMVEGLPNKAIAIAMEIAPRTVEMHRANLMAKLGVRNLAEVVRMALPLDLPSLRSRSQSRAQPRH